MYANRHDGSRATRSISAGAALIVNGALFSALILAVPSFVKGPGERVLETRNVPLAPPPPIEPVKPREVKKAEAASTPPLHQADPIVRIMPTGPVLERVPNPVIPSFDAPIGPTGAGAVTIDPPAPPPPVMISAEIDSRHAGSFQPDYPGPELRMGKEGLVRVRVLIGADGRVKAVEQIESPTAGFFETTRRHAINKWRFKPATRDGIPYESWKVMTVRFRIDG